MKVLVISDENGHFHIQKIDRNPEKTLGLIKKGLPDHYADCLEDVMFDYLGNSETAMLGDCANDQDALLDTLGYFEQRGTVGVLNLEG